MLRDDQWERIEGFLQGKAGDPGRHGADNRLFVEAVLWIARTGSPWRDLPSGFGAWNSVYVRFARWSAALHSPQRNRVVTLGCVEQREVVLVQDNQPSADCR